jgi:pilus assembly protein FimV
MKRKLLLVLAIIALPGLAHALGLGKLQLNSALNQPFDARIELVSASADELDSLNVGLADSEAFRRARIDRPFILGKLKFVVVENESGADYIQISSRDALREPFLNFLLEANWSSGRLYREYTVLLDPPLYDPTSSSRSSDYSSAPSSSDENYYIADTDADSGSESSSMASSSVYSDSEYGPTSGSDTLWSIATQVRPDSAVSVQQMMLALLRTNPDAFAEGNINGLKRGQILNIPSRDEIDSVSSEDALADVKLQNSSWQQTSGMLAEEVTERPDSMSMSETEAEASAPASSEESSAMIEDDESELRLVAASSDGAMAQDMGDSSGGDNAVDLSLANEQIDVISQENAELKERVRENETIIEDLKRLISLKDDELAALQQQMASGGTVVAESEELQVMDEEVEEEQFAEEVLEEDIVEEDSMMSEAAEEELFEEDESLLVSEEVDEAVEEIDEEEVVEEEEALADEPDAAMDVAESTPPPASMLDRVIGFITGNLILIAGGIGGIILAIIALLFISRRKQNASDDPASAAITEFPDFDDADAESESETVLPEASADAEVDMSEEETISPAEDVAEAAAAPEPEAEVAPAPEAEAEAEEPEEDPLAEVNVFLAYEHFDQAEEFVREAITGDPDNLEFHAKLLEVFYAANDLKSYEEAAQVLHDKVNGEGAHWEMALAMWQEMSPNRALFEEGGDDLAAAAPAADASGGIMDITAEEESDGADAGVDFDLGMDMGAEEPPAAAEAESEEMLDITASGEDEDLLDVTAAVSVDSISADEDLLDVTAAVGLETEELVEAAGIETAEDEPMLDITAGVEAPPAEDDVLDISHGGGEDLLDVTANASLESDDLEEDLMDITSSSAADADGEELLELPAEEASDDDSSVDFDIGGMDAEAEAPAAEVDEPVEASSDDNSLDFDLGGMEVEAEEPAADAEISEEQGSDDDNALDFDMGDVGAADEAGDDGGVELDLSIGDSELEVSDDAAQDSNEISIDDLSDDSDEGLEIDMSADESDQGESLDIADLELDTGDDELSNDLEIDLTLEDDSDAAEAGSADGGLEMDFDLEIPDDSADEPSIDMDGTVEMPKVETGGLGMDLDDDDDDEEEDHTVFVPRAGAASEQTSEDEIATKLDLAKAYVELGDKDSAKGILDEVMTDGNEEQKRTAQDLISQID